MAYTDYRSCAVPSSPTRTVFTKPQEEHPTVTTQQTKLDAKKLSAAPKPSPDIMAALQGVSQQDLLDAIKVVMDKKGIQAPVVHPYPLNAAGIPDYRTVVIACDHIMLKNTPATTIQKMVFSTEEVYEAAINLHAYYGDPITPDVYATLSKVEREQDDLALIHFVPQRFRDRTGLPIFHVVLSVDCYDRIMADLDKGHDSHLLTRNYILNQCELLVESAADTQRRLPSMLALAMFETGEGLNHEVIDQQE